jgi:hypothetical protein
VLCCGDIAVARNVGAEVEIEVEAAVVDVLK